jgi:hypothetical protein
MTLTGNVLLLHRTREAHMLDGFDLEKELKELSESKDLLKSISDIDLSKHIVDAVCEATGLPPWQVKLAYKVLAPLVGCMGQGAGKLLSDAAKQKMLSLAGNIPWTKKVVKAIKDHTTKTTQEIKAGKDAKEYLATQRPSDQAALEFRKELSLEFNVALDTYAATHELKGTFAEFGVSLDAFRAELATIKGFVNPQPAFKQPLSADRRHRFVYRSGFIPFFGRVEEMEKLDAFLAADPEKVTFRWWAITAPGGAGKSRLAWEFCLRNGAVWRAGFLTDIKNPNVNFANWQPERPTLLVLDYASKDREEVKNLLSTLAERSNLDCAVRVLLLDRDNSGEWLKGIWSSSGGHKTEDWRHAQPWELTASLDEVASKEVMKFFLSNGRSIPERSLGEHLRKLREIDPKIRPLFAAFYADAVARDGAGRSWDRKSLISDVIKREKENYWQCDGKRIIQEKDEALLALATMAGGVRSTHPDLPQCVTPMAELLNHAERFDALGGYSVADDDGNPIQTIPPWEPDLVGELFVLDVLEKRGKTGTNPLCKPLVEAAWRLSPFGFFSFLDRAAQDYVRDETLPALCLPPDGPLGQRVWALLAVNLVARFGGARLDESSQIYGTLKALAGANADDQDIAHELAKAAVNLINVYGKAGEMEKAETCRQDILNLLALEQFKDNQDIAHELAKAAFNLISSYGKAGEMEKAEACRQDILNLLALEQFKDNQDIAPVLALSEGVFAILRYTSGQPAQAREHESAFLALRQHLPSDPRLEKLVQMIADAKTRSESQ